MMRQPIVWWSWAPASEPDVDDDLPSWGEIINALLSKLREVL
jgi:hypothetical protein